MAASRPRSNRRRCFLGVFLARKFSPEGALRGCEEANVARQLLMCGRSSRQDGSYLFASPFPMKELTEARGSFFVSSFLSCKVAPLSCL